MHALRPREAHKAHCEELITALGERHSEVVPAENIALVVAHPDDETIGCGAQLVRLRGISIVVVTDGAPEDLYDAHLNGFDSVATYAAARRMELHQALAIAGIREQAATCFDIPDQQAALYLVPIVHRLVELFTSRGIRYVLTHCYEGGHPDHDATAFCVHAAAALVGASHHPVGIVEMPYYYGIDGHMVTQRFAEEHDSAELAVLLSPAERTMKQHMMAAHATQTDTLSLFNTECERFRCAPAYDFTRLPSERGVLYDLQNWGLKSAQWCERASDALRELQLPRVL